MTTPTRSTRTRHTPLPWALCPEDAGTPWNIEGPNGENIAMTFQLVPVAVDYRQMGRRANAEYIVMTANAYPTLKAERDELLALVREMNDAAEDYARLVSVENFPAYDMAVTRAYERVRSAGLDYRALLARIEGGGK